MQELAQEGGCLMVDVKDPDKLAQALRDMITKQDLRQRLANEAGQRPMKTWAAYANEVYQEIESFPESKAIS